MSSVSNNTNKGSSTRVCLKNVPRHWTEGDVRAFVEQRLLQRNDNNNNNNNNDDEEIVTITDCRVLRRSSHHSNDNNSNDKSNAKSSKSRGLAFCGFRTHLQAARCVAELHRAYAGTSRLHVEWAVQPRATVVQPQHGENEKEEEEAGATAQATTTKDAATNQKDKNTREQQQLSQSKDGNDDAAARNANKKKEKEFRSAVRPGGASANAPSATKQRNKFWANDDGDDMGEQQQQKNDKVETETTRAPPPPLQKQKLQASVDDDDDDDDDDSSSTSSSSSDDDDDSSNSDSDDSDDDDDADPLQQLLQPKQHNRKKDNSNTAAMDFLRSKQKAVDDLETTAEQQQQQDDEDAAEDAEDVEAHEKDTTNVASNDDDDGSSSSSSDSSSSGDSSSDIESDRDVPMKQPDKAVDGAEAAIDANDDDDDNDDDDNHHHHSAAQPEESNSDSSSNNRLFLRNLPFAANEDDICRHLQQLCSENSIQIAECHIARDDSNSHHTGGNGNNSKGFAFVRLETAAQAAQVLQRCDGSDFMGRLLHILPARRQRPLLHNHDDSGEADHDNDNNNNNASRTYKQQRERERQQQAAASQQGWSASFVRSDAVVDNLAARLGLRKGDIFGLRDHLSSGDAAVRLALGETAVIEENRSYFAQHGIDMEALVSWNSNKDGNNNSNDKNVERSKTSLLVKNLPHDTAPEELQKMFSKGDPVILLPPSRTIAVVQYRSASDAKSAFRKLAYRRFRSVPLYLEWAPVASKMKHTGDDDDDRNSNKRKLDETADKNEETAPAPAANNGDDDEAPLVGPTATLYVKNLNFATTEDELRAFFSKHSQVRAVRIPKKVAPIKKGASSIGETTRGLSMGFGFVEFASQEAARGALKKLQGALLDGHALELKPSSNAQAAPGTAASSKAAVSNGSSNNKTPSKLMVRNVPFQATRKELLQLFGSFGQLKKVRLPKKLDGRHRGFAFVEYLTGKDAAHAMKALSRTHLYGRHLVLEWAARDEEVEDLQILREKAGRDLLTTAAPKGKRIKFD